MNAEIAVLGLILLVLQKVVNHVGDCLRYFLTRAMRILTTKPTQTNVGHDTFLTAVHDNQNAKARNNDSLPI